MRREPFGDFADREMRTFGRPEVLQLQPERFRPDPFLDDVVALDLIVDPNWDRVAILRGEPEVFQIERLAGRRRIRLLSIEDMAPGVSHGAARTFPICARLLLRIRRLALSELLLHQSNFAGDRGPSERSAH